MQISFYLSCYKDVEGISELFEAKAYCFIENSLKTENQSSNDNEDKKRQQQFEKDNSINFREVGLNAPEILA